MATLDFYINTKLGIDPASSLVFSDTNTRANSFTPKFVVGDTCTVRVYLVDGNGLFDSASGAVGYSIKMGIGIRGSTPTGGAFTLSDGTYTTGALAFDASADTVQTALNALNSSTGPYGGQVSVSKDGAGLYLVTWAVTGSRANLIAVSTALTPLSGIVVSEEQAGDGSTVEKQAIKLAANPVVLQDTFSTVTNGWQGTLPFNSYSVEAALGDDESVTDVLEVELTDPSGNRRTVYAGDATIIDEVIDQASMVPAPLPDYFTALESKTRFVQNRSDITGLTGGTSSDFDSIATASGSTVLGTIIFIEVSGVGYSYELVAGTDSESSPDIIRPDDYATTTNEFVWKLRRPLISTSALGSYETIASFSTAGNSDVTQAADSIQHTAAFTATAGGGTFTRTLTLLTSRASAGDLILISGSLPASVNPTVEIRNATSGGVLLTSFSSVASATQVSGIYSFNGTAWIEISANYVE